MGLELVSEAAWDEALGAARTRFVTTGVLPDVFHDPVIGAYEIYLYADRDSPIPLEDIDLPSHDSRDPIQRALLVGALTSLLAGAEEYTRPLHQLGIVARLRQYLADTELPLTTLNAIRWEIQAAVAARDLARIIACCDRWLELDSQKETLIIAAETVLAVLSDRTDDCIGYLDPYWAPPPLPEVNPDPVLNPGGLQRYGMFVWATTINRSNPLCRSEIDALVNGTGQDIKGLQSNVPLDPWSGLPLDQDRALRLQLVHAGSRILQSIGPSRLSQQPHLAAFSAWCQFAIGALEENSAAVSRAAAGFAQMHEGKYPRETAGVVRAAADCYQYVGLLQEAEIQVRRWIELLPSSADAYKRLAEVLYKQERISEAVPALETYMRLSDERSESSWVDSLALRLGLEAQGGIKLLLESAAEQAKWAPMGQRLAEWQHPWLSRLCPEAKRRWWAGLYAVSSSEARENLPEQTVWELAADAFGEAVAMELRHSVLRPFREAHPAEPSTTPLPDHWKKAREGNATLGNLLHCLMNAKYPPLPVARGFSAWLQQHKKPLFEYICRRDVDLLRLAKLRGAAQHNTVTQAEARQVFQDAAALLQHIVSG